MSLVAFQRAQQISAERQRTVVEGVKMAVEDEHLQAQSVRFLECTIWLVMTLCLTEKRVDRMKHHKNTKP